MAGGGGDTALAFGCVLEAKAPRDLCSSNSSFNVPHCAKSLQTNRILACRAIILLGIPVFRMSARLEVCLALHLHADAIVNQLS